MSNPWPVTVQQSPESPRVTPQEVASWSQKCSGIYAITSSHSNILCWFLAGFPVTGFHQKRWNFTVIISLICYHHRSSTLCFICDFQPSLGYKIGNVLNWSNCTMNHNVVELLSWLGQETGLLVSIHDTFQWVKETPIILTNNQI